jgi:DNA-binding NarL/FixJ family response regulator
MSSFPRSSRAEVPPRTNLPAPLTSFIGRTVELAELQRQLTTTRLLTLVGVGGVGKTRLALCAAAEVSEAYPDGVRLVELAPLADSTLLPAVVAAGLGVREQPSEAILWLEEARRRLGEPAYDVDWNQGRDLSLEQAVSLGLEEENVEPLVAVLHPLSAREQEVAQLVARGCTNREIAQQLVIAPRTADTHVGNILSKLNLHSRAELAAWAVAHGLIAGRSD